MKTRYRPSDLLARYYAIRDATTLEALMRSPAHQKTREMWCAAQFGLGFKKHVAPCSVILDVSEPADFALEVAGSLHPFQLTEVMEPGRRRSDEYKHRTPVAHDWQAGEENGLDWVRDGIAKKAMKNYDGSLALHLVVYLNFPAVGQYYLAMRERSANLLPNFASVWLLNGNALCCLHSDGSLPGLEGWGFIAES